MRCLSLLLLCMSLMFQNASANDVCQVPGDDTINVVIFYPSATATGSKHREGIIDACRDFVSRNEKYKGKIFLEKVAYSSEKDGVIKLKSMFENGTSKPSGRKVHMILGPSESGLFVKSIEAITPDPDNGPDKGIPVISPQVIAKVGNVPDGWFFRVNVDVDTRSEIIYDYLNRKGFQNIAVLYADITLGQRSEQAFSRLLTEVQKENYLVAAYTKEKEEIRPVLRRVLDQRPGAIGIFGQRSDIEFIARKIKGMDDGWSQYTPALFTNIDASPLERNDLHFVSLVTAEEIKSSKIDEVYALAYDTAMLTLNLIQQNGLKASSELPVEMRNHLVNFLDGPPEPSKKGKYTRMMFDNFDNQAVLEVMAFQQDILSEAKVILQPGFEWLNKCQHWLTNLQRRFGYTPYWNILLVLVTGIIINLIDLTKLYGVPLSYMKRKEFLQLISVNVSVALGVYLFMSYVGILRWDDTWGAILAVSTYTVFLKAKIFGSEKAKAIGLADFYNRIVRNKHDKIMIAMLHKEGKSINYIAYTNTLVYLQKVLYEIYDFTEKGRAGELKDKLQLDLQAVDGLVDKRKILANKIHEKLSWSELQEKRLVPHDIDEENIESSLPDPLVMVQIGADYCFANKMNQADLEATVRKEIRSIRDKNKAKAKEKDFDTDLNNDFSSRALLETTVLWLFIQNGFDANRLVEKKYLPKDFKEKMIAKSNLLAIPEERRKFKRTRATDVGVGVREPAVEGRNSMSIKSADLIDASRGGASLNLLKCDAHELRENMEVEVVTPEHKSVLSGIIVYLKKDDKINTVGIKWKDLPTGIEDDLLFLAPAT